MIKVLAINSYTDPWNSVRPEMEWLTGLHQLPDFQVDVMADGHFMDVFRQAGMRVISYHPTRKFSREAIQRIRQSLQEGGHDILLSFNNKAIANGNLAVRGLPVKVVTYRGAAGLYWHDPGVYLTHYHPRVDRILCVSDYIRDHVRKNLWRHRDKAVTVYKGQQTAWYEEVAPTRRKSLGIPEEAILVGCVANVRPVKGVRYLVESTAHFVSDLPIHLMLVGRGTDGPNLRKRTERRSLKNRIHPLGFRRDALSLIATCDLYVQPSLSEGLSKTIFQAMGLCKPVIGTHAGSIPEVVADGESGLLVPVRDPKAIANAVNRLAADPELSRRMGQAGYHRLKTIFSIEQTVARTATVFRELIS